MEKSTIFSFQNENSIISHHPPTINHNQRPYLSYLNTSAVEEFQKKLNEYRILEICKLFQENGEAHEGKVSYSIFKKVCYEIGNKLFRDRENFVNNESKSYEEKENYESKEQQKEIQIYENKLNGLKQNKGKINELKIKEKKISNSSCLFEKVCTNEGKIETNFEIIIECIFDRFKMEKSNEKIKDEDKIDLLDFFISMTILSRMNQSDKLRIIFKLTDVADDECLSRQAILKMINRIERNFSKESCPMIINSSTILQEIASKKAQRKFHRLTLDRKLDSEKDKNSLGNKQDVDYDVISYKEFLAALKKKEELYRTFLPENYQMIKVLKNLNSEFSITVSDEQYDQIDNFRKDLHLRLRKDDQHFIQEQKVKLPGIISSKNKTPLLNYYDKKKLKEQVYYNNKEMGGQTIGSSTLNFNESLMTSEKLSNMRYLKESQMSFKKKSEKNLFRKEKESNTIKDDKNEAKLNKDLISIENTKENHLIIEKHRKRLAGMVQAGELLNSQYNFIRQMRKKF